MRIADHARRWVHVNNGILLHRLAVAKWDEYEWRYIGRSRMVCGLAGAAIFPGVMARIYAPRCPRCCDRLRIPQGEGAPFNHPKEKWKNR
jgi:hypothetical protein